MKIRYFTANKQCRIKCKLQMLIKNQFDFPVEICQNISLLVHYILNLGNSYVLIPKFKTYTRLTV